MQFAVLAAAAFVGSIGSAAAVVVLLAWIGSSVPPVDDEEWYGHS